MLPMVPCQRMRLKATVSRRSSVWKLKCFMLSAHHAASCNSGRTGVILAVELLHAGTRLGSTGAAHRLPGMMAEYAVKLGTSVKTSDMGAALASLWLR